VQNLYFAYLFVLRAVMKAAPVLTSYQYDTGLQQEDQRTQELVTQLVGDVLAFIDCNSMAPLTSRQHTCMHATHRPFPAQLQALLSWTQTAS
jgi:hypothetical protein